MRCLRMQAHGQRTPTTSCHLVLPPLVCRRLCRDPAAMPTSPPVPACTQLFGTRAGAAINAASAAASASRATLNPAMRLASEHAGGRRIARFCPVRAHPAHWWTCADRPACRLSHWPHPAVPVAAPCRPFRHPQPSAHPAPLPGSAPQTPTTCRSGPSPSGAASRRPASRP